MIYSTPLVSDIIHDLRHETEGYVKVQISIECC